MLRATNILRERIAAAAAASSSSSFSFLTTNTAARSFTTTSINLAVVRQKEGKKKQVLRKRIDPNKQKQKKTTGLTHLPFRDAVRNLNLEQTAPTLIAETLSNKELKAGTVTKYEKSIEKSLTALNAFKKYQHHEMFQTPISLVTSNTIKINEEFVEKLDGESKSNRIYIDGIKGSGKSTLINQAISLAQEKFNNEAIVLYLNSGEVIGNGTSDYVKNSKLGVYQQPMLTKRWIHKILSANANIFKKLKLTKDIKFAKDKLETLLKANTATLYDFLSQNRDMGKVHPTYAFQFFIEQLVEHSQNVPIIVSVDDFNALADYPWTKYKHPDFTPIHVNEFEIGQFLLKCASGEINFAKGGVLLGKSNDFALNRQTVKVGVYPNEEYNPFLKMPIFDFDLANSLTANGGIKPFKVLPFTKEEVRSLMQFWKDQGVLIVREDFHKKDYEKISDSPEINIDEQFEKLVQALYVNNQGNPYGMIKQAVLSY